MSYETEKDLGDNRFINGVDILQKSLEYRAKLSWSHTELSELYAFVAYACAFPTRFVALVDSYSTLNSGVKNFICVYLSLYDLGYHGKEEGSSYGVRLDSGDLALLSTEAKHLFKHAADYTGYDLSHLIVFASNDINESVLLKLNKSGHNVDAFGIGTNLVTCQAQPALGMVYKLVDINGVAKIKLSEEREKTTLPGEKQIIRVYTENDGKLKPALDMICLAHETESFLKTYNSGHTAPLHVYKPFGDVSKPIEITPAKVEALSILMFDCGNIVETLPHIKDRRTHCM